MCILMPLCGILMPLCGILMPLCGILMPLCGILMPPMWYINALCGILMPLCGILMPLCGILMPLCGILIICLRVFGSDLPFVTSQPKTQKFDKWFPVFILCCCCKKFLYLNLLRYRYKQFCIYIYNK